MSDIEGLRTQIREGRAAPVARAGGGLPFWLIAAGAAALGFAIVLFTPRFYTAPRTAALPVTQAAVPRAEAGESAARSVAPEPPGGTSRYAGKTPEEVVRAVEIVCDERARLLRSAPAHGAKINAADERLHCFLAEAPARFCAPNLKRKVTADIINYFKGIEYTNTAVAVAARLPGAKPDLPLATATVDPRVVEAIEALMRAGYLTKAHRDDIAANVPREVKERFARIVGSTPSCPKPPWWSMFL